MELLIILSLIPMIFIFSAYKSGRIIFTSKEKRKEYFDKNYWKFSFFGNNKFAYKFFVTGSYINLIVSVLVLLLFIYLLLFKITFAY